MKKLILVVLLCMLLVTAGCDLLTPKGPPTETTPAVTAATEAPTVLIPTPPETPVVSKPFPVWAVVRGLLIGIGALIMLLAGIAIFFILWAKFVTHHRIMALFIDHKSFYGLLLKQDGNQIHLGTGKEREDYSLEDDKQFWTMFPSGLPRFVQYPVRSHLYIRGTPGPLSIDVEGLGEADTLAMTARMVMLMSDEKVLASMWHDVHSTHSGAMVQRGGGFSWITIIMLGIVLLLGGVNVFLTMSIQKMLGG